MSQHCNCGRMPQMCYFDSYISSIGSDTASFSLDCGKITPHKITMFLKAIAALAVLPCAWTVWSWYCLYRNWVIVKKTGLPYRLNPVNHANPLWMAGHKLVMPIFEKIPFGTGSFTRFGKRGWEFFDRYKAFEEMGDAMVIVTPGDIFVYVCDPDALADIFRRKSDFPRPLKIFGMDGTVSIALG